MAGRLLSGLSRLFTAFCQHHGFTCGLDDVVLVPAAERERAAILARAEARAMTASADFAGIGADEDSLQEVSTSRCLAHSQAAAVSHKRKLHLPALFLTGKVLWTGCNPAALQLCSLACKDACEGAGQALLASQAEPVCSSAVWQVSSACRQSAASFQRCPLQS